MLLLQATLWFVKLVGKKIFLQKCVWRWFIQAVARLVCSSRYPQPNEMLPAQIGTTRKSWIPASLVQSLREVWRERQRGSKDHFFISNAGEMHINMTIFFEPSSGLYSLSPLRYFIASGAKISPRIKFDLLTISSRSDWVSRGSCWTALVGLENVIM